MNSPVVIGVFRNCEMLATGLRLDCTALLSYFPGNFYGLPQVFEVGVKK
jgi:hypothetical protein